uniref:Uncharacterized protein n=1 Tax=Tanacetum cinerariifolium TaxID=118510 RepID=A0A699HA38_TANCI|nr:hypothetical protein [Tanacetum cinerariifolium]
MEGHGSSGLWWRSSRKRGSGVAETALKLQAEFDEEEQRIAREREKERERAQQELEANIALIETWDDVQAKIDVDHHLAERLSSTSLIVENIDKQERQLLDWKLMFVDDDGNPLYKADSKGVANSNSEVEEVYNETASFMDSTYLKRCSESGYVTNSLLEQWKETKRDNDYYPYDDDLYERHDMFEKL